MAPTRPGITGSIAGKRAATAAGCAGDVPMTRDRLPPSWPGPSAQWPIHKRLPPSWPGSSAQWSIHKRLPPSWPGSSRPSTRPRLPADANDAGDLTPRVTFWWDRADIPVTPKHYGITATPDAVHAPHA